VEYGESVKKHLSFNLNIMSSFMGIGETLYGEKDYDKLNHFYTATMWFTIFFLPIFPIVSYGIKRISTKFTFTGFFGTSSQYEMSKIALDKKQVITTYLVIYGTIAFLFLLFFLFPDFSSIIFYLTLIIMIGFAVRSSMRRKSST